jgi:hypothetical protein
VKKLLNVESKRNNLFTDDVDSNRDFSGKKDLNASSQMTSTDFKE